MHHRNIAEFLTALLLAGMAAAQVDRPCRQRRLPEYLRRVPHIVRPNPGLAIGYRCKMSGGCGGCDLGPGSFVYTNTVNFTIACPADFNADAGAALR